MPKRYLSLQEEVNPSDEDENDDDGSTLQGTSPRSSRESEDNGSDPGRHVHCTFCGSDKTVVLHTPSNGSKHIQCYSCGKESTSQTSSTTAASRDATLDLLVLGMPDTPESTLEDTVSIEESGNASRSVRNESERVYNQLQSHRKIPEQGVCNFARSLENPCKRTLKTTFFVLARQHLNERQQKTFNMYFVPSKGFQQVDGRIRGIADGGDLVPLGNEHSGSQYVNDYKYFHDIYIAEKVKVSFEMTDRLQTSFRMRYPGPTAQEVISTYDIRSKSEIRICPGARAQLCVECLGEPGEICEGEVRVAIVNGQLGTRTMVFPIWAFGAFNEA